MFKWKLLLYCTKAKPYLLHMPKDNEEFEKGIEFSLTSGKNFKRASIDVNDYSLNGKIIAECNLDVEEIFYDLYGDLDWQHDYLPTTKTMSIINLENASCMDRKDIEDQMTHDRAYALHIKNLHILDRPKETTEYEDDNMDHLVKSINKSMGYLAEPSTKVERMYQQRVYLSLSSQEMCRVLNGEQTVIVRKNILKGLI